MPAKGFLVVIIWIIVKAYIYGKRCGKPWRYTLLAIPVGISCYMALMAFAAWL